MLYWMALYPTGIQGLLAHLTNTILQHSTFIFVNGPGKFPYYVNSRVKDGNDNVWRRHLAPNVQKAYSALYLIYHYEMDDPIIHWIVVYLVDNAIQLLNNSA